MLSRISQSLNFIEDILKDYFVRDKVTVQNLMGYIRVTGEFALLIHFFACLWLSVGALHG